VLSASFSNGTCMIPFCSIPSCTAVGSCFWISGLYVLEFSPRSWYLLSWRTDVVLLNFQSMCVASFKKINCGFLIPSNSMEVYFSVFSNFLAQNGSWVQYVFFFLVSL
jgi:hypothetical protein